MEIFARFDFGDLNETNVIWTGESVKLVDLENITPFGELSDLQSIGWDINFIIDSDSRGYPEPSLMCGIMNYIQKKQRLSRILEPEEHDQFPTVGDLLKIYNL